MGHMDNLFRRILFSCLMVFGFLFVGKTGSHFSANTEIVPLSPEELAELFNDETFLYGNAKDEPEEAAFSSEVEEESSEDLLDQREPAARRGDAFSYRISSRRGWRRHPVTGRRRFHAGTDYAAPCRTPINSRQTGQIVGAGWMGGYGKTVLVNYGRCTALYGHMSAIYVGGGTVQAGTRLGLVGRTGLVTGCHLHYEDCSATRRGPIGGRRGYPVTEPQYYQRQRARGYPPQEHPSFMDWFFNRGVDQ